jgi:hypothetical protein
MLNALRVAGWGTLGFSIAFFVTFVINALINMGSSGPDYPTASEMAADFGGGALFMLTWGTAGVALVVSAVGLSAAVWPADAIASRIATSFGVIAGAGWIMSGVSGFAQRTPLLNGNIAAVGADPAAERAVVEGLFIGVHTGGILFGLAALPWLAIVAVGAAKRHAMSLVAIVGLWVAAVASLAGFLISGLQFGLLGVLLAFAVVGVSLLRRARRASRMPEAAASAPDEVSAPAA